jgi:hypothetical protein
METNISLELPAQSISGAVTPTHTDVTSAIQTQLDAKAATVQ